MSDVPAPSPISRGILLGIANTAFVSLGLSFTMHDGLPLAAFIFMIALLPGVLTGALLGFVAGELAGARRWLRLSWLIVPAELVVIALGEMFHLRELELVSSIPTIVACLVLERGTRRSVAPPVPVALARRY